MPAKTKKTARNHEESQIDGRRREYESFMDWLRDRGLRHIDTIEVTREHTMKVYQFAGEILIVQERAILSCPSFEFFMPVTQATKWEDMKTAFQAKLDATK